MSAICINVFPYEEGGKPVRLPRSLIRPLHDLARILVSVASPASRVASLYMNHLEAMRQDEYRSHPSNTLWKREIKCVEDRNVYC